MIKKSIIAFGINIVFFIVSGALDSGFCRDAAAQTEAPIISGIIINIRDVSNQDKWKKIAEDLLSIHKNMPFSEEKLKEIIEALKMSGKFEKIHVDSKEDEKGIMLVFDLTPFCQIKDIRIAGAFPLFQREILNVMTVYTGDTFTSEDIPEQEKRIRELYIREGYISPEISVNANKDPEDGYFIIDVNINKGKCYMIKELNITGNESFSTSRLKLRMKTWFSSLLFGKSRFVENNLKKDIKDLLKFYRKKGYPDITVDYKLEKNEESASVAVLIYINEGELYIIDFSGNAEFWDYTLKDDIVFYEQGNENNTGLKKSLENMITRYHQAGYLDVKIKVEDEKKIENSERIRNICFVIDEGIQSRVSAIQIAGNDSLEEKQIKGQILTRTPGIIADGQYVPQTLTEDIDAIRSLYLKRGYMEAQIEDDVKISPDKSDVGIYLQVKEGVQTLVESVNITGVTTISEQEALEAIELKTGEPFREYMITSDKNILSSMISEKGYPHVQVESSVSFSQDKSKADIVYIVNEGPYVEMGNIYFSGNFRTRERIIRNEIKMKPGEPFSLSKLLQSQKNIRDIEALRSVQFKAIGLKEKSERVNFFVEVEEKKPYFFQIGGGYDTERHIFLNTKAGDHNLLGANKDAWIGAEASEIGYRIESGITEPRLFGTRISSTFSIFGEQREEFNQSFGTRTYGASLGFFRRWSDHITTSLSFRYEQREQFERDSEISIGKEEEFDPRSILVTTPSIAYDSRDSFIRPRKGFYSSFSLDISKGLENSLDDFLKYRFDLRYYITPFQPLTFACYGRFGYIDPFGSDTVPDDQIFFLGGTTDVRGFDENLLRFDNEGKPLGGCQAVSGSIEARIDLGMNFELALFYDIGSITDAFEESDTGKYRTTVGLGLRYITPIGPIGFLYGYKLDSEEDESAGRLHFSMGYTF